MLSFRQFIALFESSFHSAFMNKGKYTEIHRDPRESKLRRICKDCPYGRVRGMIHKDKVYAWASSRAFHSDVGNHLKIPKEDDKHVVNFDADPKAKTVQFYSPEFKADTDNIVKNHPWVQKNLKGYKHDETF